MINYIIEEIMGNMLNIIIIGLILFLALIDLFSKKNFKSQIVSLGVLGTFIGIFIGLQNFNPEDMKNSINSILLGLKTAFLTSIAGMVVAIFLAIIEKFKEDKSNSTSKNEYLLSAILKKLDLLEHLNSTESRDKIIGELERLRTVQRDTRDETKKVSDSIDILKDTSNKQNEELISILNRNFTKMNISLEIAIDKLSKGATEEIIKALETVIQEFNQELQSSFGDNFVKLNEAVINLLTWQENYKTHIETLDKKLDLSTTSIEKSKESLEIISSKNEDILEVYKSLAQMINTSKRQINRLNEELETYGDLSDNAKDMFTTIEESIKNTEETFKSLSQTIRVSNNEQKESSLRNNEEIKVSYQNLTKDIKENNDIQTKNSIETFNSMINNVQGSYEDLIKVVKVSNNEHKESLLRNNEEIKVSYQNLTKDIKEGTLKQISYNKEIFENLRNNFEKNKKELDIISNHFKNLGEEIPKALQVSLQELNRGLTSLTIQFQKDYKETLEEYNRGLNSARR
ncbi:putative membrane protein [hydrothermal vent metagenome]|uniref:Putative membrane protein n=1 Tax=hydrothermal vent metagenome TaxID=652676 RepID=A0A1W1EJQ1_9ZZZZ